jgi:diacylglycerol kinase family enzyme
MCYLLPEPLNFKTATPIILRRFGFIFNSRAGPGHHAALIQSAMAGIRALGDEAHQYECHSSPAEPVAHAIRDECTVIVACGGDGTVSGVAAAIRDSHLPLGVFPLGTLNHFAKDLGIHSIAEAEHVLLKGRVREIDTGAVNGRLFINNSGIGIYPAIVLEREKVRRSGIPKWPAFLIASIRALIRLPFLRLHLEADGLHLARITPFLFVGNNVYETEGRSIGTRAKMDEGLLGVCTARHHGPTGLIRIAFRALAGTVRQDRDFTLLTVRRLTVRTRRRAELDVSLDGELWRLRPPLHYSVLPRALRVLVP